MLELNRDAYINISFAGIMLSDISQAEKDKYYVGKRDLEWWLPGTGGWGKWGDVRQRAQTSRYKMSKFWDLVHSVAITVNNTDYVLESY